MRVAPQTSGVPQPPPAPASFGLLDLFHVAGAAVAVIVVLFLLSRLLQLPKSSDNRDFRRHLIMLALTLFGVLVVIFFVPNDNGARDQLLQLFGVVLSATIALASTSFLGNALAGIQMRVVGAFRAGDFLRVGEHFGRVTERGLFHTEIQTEDRDLTTLPNLYLVSNPYKVVRSSGTIISGTVSLGYDVPRTRVKKLLLAAAARTGLADPFIQVTELGDFAVTYRVAGLLSDVKWILSSRSDLRKQMLDALHGDGIEIVSPTIMNTRPLGADVPIVPETIDRDTALQTGRPEALMFDKAEQAAALEKMASNLARATQQLDALKASLKAAPDTETRAALEADLTACQERCETLQHNYTMLQEKIAAQVEGEDVD